MVDSPCKKECKLEGDICVACKRTIDEIVCWRHMNAKDKQKIYTRLAQLEEQLPYKE